MSVSVWVSKIFFKTGFSGLGLGFGFHPWWYDSECNRKGLARLCSTLSVEPIIQEKVAPRSALKISNLQRTNYCNVSTITKVSSALLRTGFFHWVSLFGASRLPKIGHNLEKRWSRDVQVKQCKKRVFTVWNEFSLDWLCVARLTRLWL